MESIASVAQKIDFSDTDDNEWQTYKPKPMKIPQQVTLAELDTSHHAVSEAVKMARAWADRKRDGHDDASIVFSGPYGTGKTHIAKAILWSMKLQPEGGGPAVPAGRFFLANDLMQRLTPTRDSQTGITVTPRPDSLVGNAPLVVIDDVGGEQKLSYIAKEHQKEEFWARYFSFINHCYTLGVSVIITTNLSIAGFEKSPFAQHIGGRAFDRLSEMAPKGFMLGLDGVPSWRKKAGNR